jgi:hypothetical protein
MPVTTQHNRSEKFRTAEDDAKIIELGGDPDTVRTVSDDEYGVYLRFWPTQESAQAWCDYVLAKGPEVCTSAVILED